MGKLPKSTPVFICGAVGFYHQYASGKAVCLDCETLEAEELEADGQAEPWVRITNVDGLIQAAVRQGVALDVGEASVILGYLEGHDYCLMANAEGQTMRHDEQYGDDHRQDEPYTVQDAVEFCQAMNEELLREAVSSDGTGADYLSQLQKDEQTLDALMVRLMKEVRQCGS